MSEEQKKSGAPSLADISHDLFAVRSEKLNQLRAAGEDPFRANWRQTHTSKDWTRRRAARDRGGARRRKRRA